MTVCVVVILNETLSRNDFIQYTNLCYDQLQDMVPNALFDTSACTYTSDGFSQ